MSDNSYEEFRKLKEVTPVDNEVIEALYQKLGDPAFEQKTSYVIPLSTRNDQRLVFAQDHYRLELSDGRRQNLRKRLGKRLKEEFRTREEIGTLVHILGLENFRGEQVNTAFESKQPYRTGF